MPSNYDHHFHGNETKTETKNSRNGSYLHELEISKQNKQQQSYENIHASRHVEKDRQTTIQPKQHLRTPNDPDHHHHHQGPPSADIENGDSLPISSSRSPSISLSSLSSPFIWRPIMPGYTSEKGNAQKIEDIENDGKKENKGRFGWASRGSIFEPVGSEVSFKKAIPAMPKSLACLCFACNCFVPGMGTFLSGISIGCHLSISRNGPEVPLSHVVCVNIRTAFLQLITTPLFFIGWFWSVLWAVAFVIISDEYETLKPLIAASTRTTTTTTTTTTTHSVPSRCSSAHLMEPSIIVLHQAPIIIQPRSSPIVIRQRSSDITTHSQSNASMNSRRSQRIRRRARIRPNGLTLNPILMDPATLEQLVHHSSIVPLPETDFVALSTAKDVS